MVLKARFIIALAVACSAIRVAQAESWECGGAKVDCSGTPETCQRLKQACNPGVVETSDVERELAHAVQQAQSGAVSAPSSDPFARLSQSVAATSCTEQQAREGKCGFVYNAKELVASVVDSIKVSVDALNEASRVLAGN